MGLAQVTAPSEEPLTLAELKTHLRVDTTDDDTYISGLGQSAREWCEGFCNRQFVTATWDWSIDRFQNELLLPKPELQSVGSIKYIDSDGATQTVSSSIYDVDIDQQPGRVRLAYGKSWPDDRRATPNCVIIRFDAGYGGASAVPETIKAAMKLLVGHLYEHREAVTLGHLSRSLQYGLERLLYPYKMPEV